MEELMKRLEEWGQEKGFEVHLRNNHFFDPEIILFDRSVSRYFAFTLSTEMIGQVERLISEIEWYMMEVD